MMTPNCRFNGFLLLAFALGGCNCGKEKAQSSSLVETQGVTVSPDSLDFGLVPVGTSLSKAVALSNGGTGPLDINSVSLVETDNGGGPIQYAPVGFSPVTLSPGQALPLQIAFSPTSPGTHTATLTINTDDGDMPTTVVSLTGIGLQNSVTVSPAAIDFNCVLVGANSQTGNVTVTNNSIESETVTIGSVQGSSDFQVSPVGTQTLAAGAQLNLQVVFQPTATQAAEATVSITACTTCTPITLSLQGSGAELTLTAAPSFVDFGVVPEGQTSLSTPLTVAMTTSAGSCAASATLAGPPTMQDGTQGFAVAPDGTWPATLGQPPAQATSARFTVQYTGQTAGAQNTDNVVVAYSVAGQPTPTPLLIPVQASASKSPCAQLVPSPNSLNFGTVTTGQTATKSLTLTNRNTETCTITDVELQNDTNDEFSLTSSTPTAPIAIAAGQSVVLDAEFAPTNSGSPASRSGSLTITTADTVIRPMRIPMTGNVKAQATISACLGTVTVAYTPETQGKIIDIDTGYGDPLTEPESGPAAIGFNATDYWNAAAVGFSSDWTAGPLSWADGSASNVTAEAINLPGDWGWTAADCDKMVNNYGYSWSGSTAQIELRGMDPGSYDIYTYCNVGAGNNTGFGINVYQSTPQSELLYSLPTQFTSSTAPDQVQWVEGDQYVVARGVCVTSGNTVEVALQNGVQGTGNAGIVINGMQILQTGSGACTAP